MKKILLVIASIIVSIGLCAQTTADSTDYVVITMNDGSQIAIHSYDIQDMIFAMPPKPTVSYLWMPGNGNGWDHNTCPILMSEGDGIYKGYCYMDGDFKFTYTADWSTELNNSSFNSVSDNITLRWDGGNITYTGAPGMCWVEVDNNAKSLTVTPVTWSIIGNFNGWADDVDMTYDTTDQCLKATLTLDGDGWKFRRDHSWNVNLGGTLGCLEPDGANLASEAKTYTVRLYLGNAQGVFHATMSE